jgi:hypothetical protein
MFPPKVSTLVMSQDLFKILQLTLLCSAVMLSKLLNPVGTDSTDM